MSDPAAGQSAAFPVPPAARQTGVAIRDWIAVAAMQGIMTKGLKVQADRAMTETERQHEMAAYAYQMADAMLHVRSQSAPDAAEPGSAAQESTSRGRPPAKDRQQTQRAGSISAQAR